MLLKLQLDLLFIHVCLSIWWIFLFRVHGRVAWYFLHVRAVGWMRREDWGSYCFCTWRAVYLLNYEYFYPNAFKKRTKHLLETAFYTWVVFKVTVFIYFQKPGFECTSCSPFAFGWFLFSGFSMILSLQSKKNDMAKLSPKVLSTLLCCSCMYCLVSTVFSVVILQELPDLTGCIWWGVFLLLQYMGVFRKYKEFSVIFIYITNLLDILGDSERRNHARFLLKYILQWFLGFIRK